MLLIVLRPRRRAFDRPQPAGALLDMVDRRRRVRGQRGELIATAVPAWRALRGDRESPCEPRALKAEQSNSSVVYGDRLILKLFRMLDSGVNPDLEIGRMLDAHAHFALWHTCLGKRHGKLAPGGAGKRRPAAMGLIIKLGKRFGERGHE